MRSTPWLLALLLLPTTLALGERDPLLEDPAGDVQVFAHDQDLGVSPAAMDRVDLRSLTLLETPTHLEAWYQVTAIEEDASIVHTMYLSFTYAGVEYQLATSSAIDAGYFARLYRVDQGTGRLSAVDDVATEVDQGTATVHVKVPRGLVIGAEGEPILPGRNLTDIGVESHGVRTGAVTINDDSTYVLHIHDEMGGDAQLRLRYGIGQTGNAHLTSPTPFRSSNGEAGTFVYEVTAKNTGSEPDVFQFSTSKVPQAWDVRIPVENLRLEAGQERQVPVLVRTPFAHQHGSLEQFLLTMTSDTGGQGGVELGIRYPLIPQPSGHHDTLWLHPTPTPPGAIATPVSVLNEVLSGRGGSEDVVLMNAVEDDARLQEGPVQGQVCDTAPNGTSPVAPVYCWNAHLDPGLDMGLDFDLTRKGSIEVPIHAPMPVNGATLGGALYYLPPETDAPSFFGAPDGIAIADIHGAAPVDLGLGETALLAGTITPRPEADLLPFQPGASLVLHMKLVTDRVDYAFFGPHLDPELQAGGHLQLPLLEYHDPINDAFLATDSLHLEAVSEQKRFVNPGSTVVFIADAANTGPPSSYSVRIVGSHAEWATLHGPNSFTLDSNKSHRISVQVTVPADAVDGDAADLVVEVASNNDLAARSLIRFVAEVDTDEEHVDEAEQARELASQANRDSPAPTWLLVALALAVLAWSRRH